jgi:hypothetical protein
LAVIATPDVAPHQNLAGILGQFDGRQICGEGWGGQETVLLRNHFICDHFLTPVQ